VTNIIGKPSKLTCLFSIIVLCALVWVFGGTTSAQEVGALEALCITIVGENPSIPPPNLTAEEFCKAVVAVLSNEWDARQKIQDAILLNNSQERRLMLHHDRIVANEVAIVALQGTDSVAGLQQQIDFINTKLAAVVAALQ